MSISKHIANIAAAGLLAIAGLPALAAPEIGKPAPAFTAVDSNGKSHALADFAGKTVVLEWTNAECPYVKKHYGSGNMQKLQSAAAKDGVVWLMVNSGAKGKQGHVSGAAANEIVAEQIARPTAYLLDGDGTIGKAYAARTTPHMYVIRPDGMLAYMGAIDSDSSADPAAIATATNYVTAALSAVKAGKKPDPAQTRPYGCSVKYGN